MPPQTRTGHPARARGTRDCPASGLGPRAGPASRGRGCGVLLGGGRPPWLDVARPCLCHPTSFPPGRGVGSGDPLHTAPCAGSRTPRVQPGAPAHMDPSYQRTHARYGRHRPSDHLGWRQQQARAIHTQKVWRHVRWTDAQWPKTRILTSPSSPSAVLPSAPGTPLPGVRGLLPCWA